jgi:hypothetical protein
VSSGFTLEPREGYLYVHLAPGFEITPQNLAEFWAAITDACRQHGLLKVLAVGDDVRRKLTPTESFDAAALMARLLPGLSVGCCFRGYRTDEQTQFFRTAAVNRGVRVEFFQDLNSALKWLGAGAETLD